MDREPYGTEAPGAPSSVARERLSRDMRRELVDLRTRLVEAQLRSEVFLSAGRPDAAARVIDEQQQMVADFSQRVDAAVSAAVVEREAEQVVAAELRIQTPPAPTRPLLGVPVGAVMAGVLAFALVLAGIVRTSPDLDLASTSEEPATVIDGGAELPAAPDIVPIRDVGASWSRPGLRWFLIEPPDRPWGPSAFSGGPGGVDAPDDATLIAQLLAGAHDVLGEPVALVDESVRTVAPDDGAPAEADEPGSGVVGPTRADDDAELDDGGAPSTQTQEPETGHADPAAPSGTDGAAPAEGDDDGDHATSPDSSDSMSDVIGGLSGAADAERDAGASSGTTEGSFER